MPSEFIRIPMNRIGVLIGTNGNTKKKIESIADCKLAINSETGEIEIQGKDAINAHRCAYVVKAIGRGFNPEKALYLMDQDYYLEIIDLKDFLGKSEKAIQTKKSRIIGSKGSMRNKIERKTNCFISVYGNTVAVIGKSEDIEIAVKVITMILEGAEFSTIDKVLRKEISIKKGVEVI